MTDRDLRCFGQTDRPHQTLSEYWESIQVDLRIPEKIQGPEDVRELNPAHFVDRLEVGDASLGWPEIYRIKVPGHKTMAGWTNVYVIKQGQDAMVVDTGAPADISRYIFSGALVYLEVDPSRAAYFITHPHLDHAGLVDDCVPKDARLNTGRADYGFMVRSLSQDYMVEQSKRILDLGFSYSGIESISRFGTGVLAFDSKGRNLKLVRDGDTITAGNLRFTVVGTPGHTPGHMTLLYQGPDGRSVLFSGDHLLFNVTPGLSFRPGWHSAMSDYIESMRKVVRLNPDWVLGAHGGYEEDWRPRAKWLVDHALRRADRTLRYIDEHPGVSGAQVIRNMGWRMQGTWDQVPAAQKWFMVETGLTVLDYLEGSSLVVSRRNQYGMVCYWTLEDAVGLVLEDCAGI